MAFGREPKVSGARIDLFNDGCETFVFSTGLEGADYEVDQVFAEGKDFVVMIFDDHLKIEAGELEKLTLVESWN